MGVPALFRWLSKKYPKIVTSVEEEDPKVIPGKDGAEVELPIDMSGRNPNGEEFDCLYLDMNGIVHPCTHPEGKVSLCKGKARTNTIADIFFRPTQSQPAPETEEDMMLEVFAYTERVVNMVRPRKLLMMAIDGVAPRAKMNQQRSRRFRAAQEAREKEEEKVAALEEWKSMGLPVTDEAAHSKKAWDSNAITPGTPFMDLLAASLRYWVAKKLSEDPGWKGLSVIISDASVPGEGEHKIMDHIRRQRVHPDHDPNTKHVIYGLDADLIMLSLATHEPYFKVLREDVFAQDNKPKTCNRCGREGHFAANCIGKAKEDDKKPLDPASDPEARNQSLGKKLEKKPFIFLDVSVLREYLEVELNVPGITFPFDLERAIDDWVFLIFFVGNDFLPHLPSLEIREGAIDMLIKIWKQNLPKVGSWLTKHGQAELSHVQIIMDGIASQEAEIFRKRQEQEERQEDRNKRRKAEDVHRQRAEMKARGETPPPMEGETKMVEVTMSQAPVLNNNAKKTEASNGAAALQAMALPAKPPVAATNMASAKNGDEASGPVDHRARALAALASGNDAEILKAQASIRLANLSSAEMLKAELAGQNQKKSKKSKKSGKGGKELKTELEKIGDGQENINVKAEEAESAAQLPVDGQRGINKLEEEDAKITEAEDDLTEDIKPVIKPEGGKASPGPQSDLDGLDKQQNDDKGNSGSDANGANTSKVSLKRRRDSTDEDQPSLETKRKSDSVEAEPGLDEADGDGDGDDDEVAAPEEDDEGVETVDPVVTTNVSRTINPDGTVSYEDTVRLFEPGYHERYYRQKFGVELSDTEFRRQIVKHYVEGLCWVLAYYYQGCPSWTWYYPYHFSPFAADFTDLESLDIKFNLGTPFRPYDQLMGVLPADSRIHLPDPFHPLMTDPDTSDIIDFYPSSFEIDMNGKKMAWQGVALLPFIDETRLLTALETPYSQLSDEEHRRNAFGDNAFFASDESPLYEELCSVYRRSKKSKKGDDEEGGKRELDTALSGGLSGYLRPDPTCIPGSSYTSPLTTVGLDDIVVNRSISVLYDFPEQRKPHRSILLKGSQPPKRTLTEEDREFTRRGGHENSRGRGRGRGGGFGGGHGGRGGYGGGRGGMSNGGGAPGGGSHYTPGGNFASSGPAAMRLGAGPVQYPPQPVGTHSRFDGGGNSYGGGQRGYGGGGGGYPAHPPPTSSYGGYGASSSGHGAPPPQSGGYGSSSYGGYGGYGASAAPPAHHAVPAGAYGGAAGGYGGYGSSTPSAAQAYGGGGGYGGYGQSPYGGSGAGAGPGAGANSYGGAYGSAANGHGGGYGAAQSGYGGYGGYGGGQGGGPAGYGNYNYPPPSSRGGAGGASNQYPGYGGNGRGRGRGR